MYGSDKRIIREYKDSLGGGSENEILYLKLEFVGAKLENFSMNLTTRISAGGQEAEFELVRYDCAHGYLHMHRFYRKPPTKEKIFMEISRQTVRALRLEITENWKSWKKAFIDNYGVYR